jgi:hypothetical protein
MFNTIGRHSQMQKTTGLNKLFLTRLFIILRNLNVLCHLKGERGERGERGLLDDTGDGASFTSREISDKNVFTKAQNTSFVM